MARPAFYPHRPDAIELRETAISWVFLAGERAYKVKKPVVLPFLDYGNLERRRHLCEEEVRLNRRLAPDVYLAARPIVRTDGGLALAERDARDAVEWAVEMRRLPEDRTLERLLQSGELDSDGVRAVAFHLAQFHARAEPASPDRGTPAAVRRPIEENFDTLLDLAGSLVDRRALAAAERFFGAFVTARRETFVERVRAERIRDCHGDLRMEHVVLEGERVLVFDCLEFDPALREIDVAADLAYLAMELVASGAGELAGELLSAYRDAGGDPGDDSLVSFYAAYRAWVRAKLAYLRATGERADQSERRQALSEAAVAVAVAERFRWRARLPLLLVVCGVTASGKSRLAGELAERSGLGRLGSDETRKRLAGIPAGERAPSREYSDEFSRRTYRELGTLAADAVRHEGGAIVDATFRRRVDRDAFREGLGGPPVFAVFVECRAPEAVLSQRAHARQRQAAQASDATPDLVGIQLREFVPLDEVEAQQHLPLRTDRPPAEAIDDLEALLDQRLS